MKELLELVKELSFVRTGGSAEERKAGELILEEVNRAAAEARFAPFVEICDL